MRILVVHESDWFDKGPLQTHHLMERLSKRGHKVIAIDYEILWRLNKDKRLISRREVFENVSKAVNGGNVTVIRPSIIKVSVLDYISLLYTHRKEIKRQLDDFNPDVIVGFGILNANIAIKLSKKKGIPFIYYIIDELHRLVPQKYFRYLARYIESENMKNADKIISINEALQDYTIQMGADKKRTEVIRAGVDLKRFSPDTDGNAIRNKYGISGDDVVLFFMGLFYKFSGLVEIALELNRLKDAYPNIKLLIVGKGECYNELKKIKGQLKDQLIIIGWQPYEKIPELISAADICLLPARRIKIMQNIVPIKIYEYMAMEKPAITTKLPGVMKEFGEGNGVIYVDRPEDVLKKAIELIENGALQRQGLKARRFVEKNNWDDIVDDFERVLEEAIKVRGGK